MPWVALAVGVVSLASKYVVPALRRKKYTPSGYELGAMFRRNVLGENFPNTDDDRKVGDSAAYIARHIFTAGFGILMNKRQYFLLLSRNDFAQYNKEAQRDYGYTCTQQQWDRAYTLQKNFFVDQPAPPKYIWDLRNFDTIPYVGRIPDTENPKRNMTVTIDGMLYVNDGVIVNPNPETISVIQRTETAQAAQDQAQEKKNNTTYYLLAAAAVGGFYLYKKGKLKFK